jgi:hypothetical protein
VLDNSAQTRNYAATLGEPMRFEEAAGTGFSFNHAATSSGSKRTDPEMNRRNASARRHLINVLWSDTEEFRNLSYLEGPQFCFLMSRRISTLVASMPRSAKSSVADSSTLLCARAQSTGHLLNLDLREAPRPETQQPHSDHCEHDGIHDRAKV